jgi:uncharacterized protein (DUF433 family)
VREPHDEPHLEGRRITVQFIKTQVEERGLEPRTVADRHDIDVADVYRALTHYHDHPKEMRAVERPDDVAELGVGSEDRSIARYAREHDRLNLAQDDDFVTEPDIEDTAGVLFQWDQTLSTREVGDAVHEMSQCLDQSDIVLEYISRNRL